MAVKHEELPKWIGEPLETFGLQKPEYEGGLIEVELLLQTSASSSRQAAEAMELLAKSLVKLREEIDKKNVANAMSGAMNMLSGLSSLGKG